MKFRSKPVVIEAQQLSNESLHDIVQWVGDAFKSCTVNQAKGTFVLKIKTLEGALDCKPSDWIIKGTVGEFYPCRNDIFRNKYEPV